MPHFSSSHRLIAAVLSLICLAGTARVDAQTDVQIDADAWATRFDVPTSARFDIPSGAFGYVLVEHPREVTLLKLRGMAGGGHAILRAGDNGRCLRFPVRFVSGDFGGEAFSGRTAEPILLVITSRRAARALAHGEDLVSDMYRVATRYEPGADIVLAGGLASSFGFVINPGRNILQDVFGLDARPVSCQSV